MRTKMMLRYKTDFCYINNVSEEDISKKTYKQNPYTVEDLMVQSEINRFCEENRCSKIDKTLKAKIMCDAILSGGFQIGEKSKNNFRELFSRIFG